MLIEMGVIKSNIKRSPLVQTDVLHTRKHGTLK